MKSSVKYYLAMTAGLFISACTMGDKGSEKVPDSVSIDTAVKTAQPQVKSSDTTLIDSLQTDTNQRVVKP
jgi:hypothetical protein